MFDGWFAFGGTEVINSARAMTYVREMLPGLATRHTCRANCACEHLAAFLGEKAYATPLIDDAPWVDTDRAESFGFLGVMTQGVTGLLDDTITGTVTEGLHDGGWVTGLRRATKQVRFSVATFAVDQQSSYFGTQWLKSALDGACGSGPDVCSPSNQLCFLTDCVDPEDFAGVVRKYTHSLPEWVLYQAGWTGQTLNLRQQTSWASLTLESGVCEGIEWELQIRGEAGDTFAITHDGVVELFDLDGSLQTFLVTSVGETIKLSIPDTTGMANWWEQFDEDVEPAEEGDFAFHETRLTDGPIPTSVYEHFTTIPLDLDVVKVVSTARYELTPEECASEFYRYLYGVTRIEGPRERRAPDYPNGGGVIRYFDFVVVSEKPSIYGDSVLVAGGSTAAGLHSMAEPYRVVRLSSNVPACATPVLAPILDPLGPVSPPPPTAPQPSNPARDLIVATPTDQPYALIIPGETVPEFTSVVPTIRVTAGTADVRYVLVRFFPIPFDDTISPNDVDPCSVCGAFEIAYIPHGATFEVNGLDEEATIEIGGVKQAANHLLTAPDGFGTPTWPVLSCGVSYMMLADARKQSLTRINVELAVRE